jgi:hypothetical protein
MHIRAKRPMPRWRWAVVLAALVGAALTGGPSAMASVTLPPGKITVPSSGTFLYMNSETGDYIGQGVEQLYTSADTTITGSLPQGGGYFRASAIQGPYTHWWYVDIAAPPGQPLTTGSYDGAVRAAFRPAGSPGLDVYGDGRGCNQLTGRFDVNELKYAPTGELLVFDATFEQHCEGLTPALYGRIRIENAPPPPDVTPPSLSLPADLTVEAPDSSGMGVSYDVSATDNRDPNPSVTCTPASGSVFPLGTTTVSCKATDSAGNIATGSFAVTVLPPLQLGVAVAGPAVLTKTAGVAVSGTVTCSRPLGVDLTGTLKQLVANKAYVTGTFSVHVDCQAPSSKWSATVFGDNGRFGSGAATLSVAASGCELSCHSATATATIRLNPAK